MKRKILTVAVGIVLLASTAWTWTNSIEDLHRDILYTTVRVRAGNSVGSGLIFACIVNGNRYDTYILTNHHVIENAISIKEEWNPLMKAMVKKETRATVEVEEFKYQFLSYATGTLLTQADILEWNKQHDIALLKLRSDEKVRAVFRHPVGKEVDLRIFAPVIVCGSGLGHAPFPTMGMISSLTDEIDNLPYHMVSAPSVFGNSGGACFLTETREFIGIPSRLAVTFASWAPNAVYHMVYIIPISRIYKWLGETGWASLYDPKAIDHEKWIIEKKKETRNEKNMS